MKKDIVLTKMQRTFIDEGLQRGDYVTYPASIFQSLVYIKWLEERASKVKKSHKSASSKLPSLEETLTHCYCGPTRESSHTASVVAIAYDFICDRLQGR